MNKRIQELITLATSKPHRVQGYGGDTTHIYPGHLDPKKFAELIVRECALLADQHQFEKNVASPPSEFIYQYFGVEE